jgi:peptidoglycan/xylan/chitin deacetylase (PgdA/CDA1 family)
MGRANAREGPRGNGDDVDAAPDEAEPDRRDGEQSPECVPRRLLLALGGVVLLGGCAVARPAEPAPSPEPSVSRRVRPVVDRKPAPARHHETRRRHRTEHETYDQPIDTIDDGRKAIALTIDDGPSPVYTPQVLRLLRHYGITASFSMIGVNVLAYPGVAREVADAGHLIVNHTQHHHNLAYMWPDEVSAEIGLATEAIHRATGRVPGMFRAPYGAWSPTVFRLCDAAGMSPLGWSVDPRDWSRPGTAAIIQNILGHTRTGSIILEHDGGGDRSQTVAALRYVLPRLLDAGYRFRTP